MYKNQYFITNTPLNNPHGLRISTFNDLNVYSHPSLNITKANHGAVEVLILGYILDPLKPKRTDEEVALDLVEPPNTKESILKKTQLLSGRFVLIFKNDVDFILLGDTLSLRKVYYGFIGEDTILTSSIKMFLDLYGNELQISYLKEQYINTREFKKDDSKWFGHESLDDRLNNLLPNHFLDIAKQKVQRRPIYHELINEKDTLEYAAEVLKGSIQAINRRFHVLQALTAGWDSRVLLAASKEIKDDILYFIFDQSSPNERHPDIWVPRNLSAKLGFNFLAIKPGRLKEEFLSKYRREHVYPKVQKNTKEIQHLFYNYSNLNAIRICGFGGEIVRCRLGYTDRQIDVHMLRYFSGYSGKSEYVNQAIDSWLDDAREYSRINNIPLLDLFFWEQITGNWGTLYSFEQDIAIEEFCPYLNSNLLLSIMKIDPSKRSFMKSSFLRDLIEFLWAEVLSEPINPRGFMGYLSGLAGRDSLLRYYKLRTQSALNSFRRTLF